ncbi:hypothetical protein D3C83_85380 [compost metagenome]
MRASSAGAAFFSSHLRKPGIGDRVAKRFRCGNSCFRSSATCLMSWLPKEMPRSPSWQLVIE